MKKISVVIAILCGFFFCLFLNVSDVLNATARYSCIRTEQALALAAVLFSNKDKSQLANKLHSNLAAKHWSS